MRKEVRDDPPARARGLSHGQPGPRRYYFTNFDDIDRLVRASSVMGVAFPLQSGEFVVVRFSLKGAVTALDVMRQAR
jgi:hypothetical protein